MRRIPEFPACEKQGGSDRSAHLALAMIFALIGILMVSVPVNTAFVISILGLFACAISLLGLMFLIEIFGPQCLPVALNKQEQHRASASFHD